MCKRDDVVLDDVLLSPSFKLIIDALRTKLEELNDALLKLQLHACTIRQARAYFESVSGVFPTVETRLNQSARIVNAPVFQSAVVKIQDTREQDLTTSENCTVRGLLLEQSAPPETDSGLKQKFSISCL